MYRKYLVYAINILVLIWLIKTTYFQPADSDYYGILLIGVIIFILLFNLYCFIVNNFFSEKKLSWFNEILYIPLIFLPFVLLWHWTS